MEQTTTEAVVQAPGGKRLQKGSGGKAALIAIGAALALLAGSYLGLCAYAGSLDTFYPNCAINGVNVAGLTVQEAQEKLARETPNRKIPLYDAANPVYTETTPELN